MKDYGLHTYVITGVLQIPIKIIDFNNKQENEYHKKISSLVQCMLDQNNALMLAKGNEKNRIQAQIIKTDQEIDELIYTLYGLSNNERKLFEK